MTRRPRTPMLQASAMHAAPGAAARDEHRDHPEGVIRFALNDGAPESLLQLAAGEAGKPARLNITAYTGEAMYQWWSDVPIVVDLDTLEIKAGRRPLLFAHSTWDPIGHVESWNNDKKTLTAVALLSNPSERSREIQGGLANGMPYQASIGGSPGMMEFIKAGETVTVNGRQFNGPIRVARKASVMELSVVTLGADDNTKTSLAAKRGAPAKGGDRMDFEKWLIQAGYSVDTMTEAQKLQAKAVFDSLHKGVVTEVKPPKITAAAGAPATPAADAPLSAEQQIEASRNALAAEQLRVAAIQKAAADHPEICAKAIKEGWTEEKATLEVLKASRQAPAAHVSQPMEAGEQAQVIEAGLLLAGNTSGDTLLKAGHYTEKTLTAARKVGPRSIGEALHLVAAAGGVHTRPGRVTDDTIRAAFIASKRRLEAGFSTMSLANVLANVQNKSLLVGYGAVEDVISRIAAKVNNPDFKPGKRVRMTANGGLEEVGPTGEVKHLDLTDEGYSNSVKTRGALLAITREVLINDDLSAMTSVPQMLGRKAQTGKQKVGFTKLMGALGTLFTNGHKNYISGATKTLSIATLNEMLQKFMDQVDAAGDPVAIMPKILLLPTSLYIDGKLICTERLVNETTTADKKSVAANPHAGAFRPETSPFISNPKISGYTSTGFFLLADPNDVALLVISYLNGQEQPVIESGEMDLGTLGIQQRIVFDFGVDTEDYRAGVYSKGAA